MRLFLFSQKMGENNPTIPEPPNNPTLGQEAQYLLTRYQYIKKKYYGEGTQLH